jgi:hypothetical protein
VSKMCISRGFAVLGAFQDPEDSAGLDTYRVKDNNWRRQYLQGEVNSFSSHHSLFLEKIFPSKARFISDENDVVMRIIIVMTELISHI